MRAARAVRRLGAASLLAVAISLTGCGDYYPNTSIDEGKLPAPKVVLAEPVFAPLKNHSPLHFDDEASYRPINPEKFEYWADNEVLSRATTILRYGYLAQGVDERGRTKIRRNILGIDVRTAGSPDRKALHDCAEALERHLPLERGLIDRAVDAFLADPARKALYAKAGDLTVKVERRNPIGLQNEYVAFSVFDGTFAD